MRVRPSIPSTWPRLAHFPCFLLPGPSSPSFSLSMAPSISNIKVGPMLWRGEWLRGGDALRWDEEHKKRLPVSQRLEDFQLEVKSPLMSFLQLFIAQKSWRTSWPNSKLMLLWRESGKVRRRRHGLFFVVLLNFYLILNQLELHQTIGIWIFQKMNPFL